MFKKNCKVNSKLH